MHKLITNYLRNELFPGRMPKSVRNELSDSREVREIDNVSIKERHIMNNLFIERQNMCLLFNARAFRRRVFFPFLCVLNSVMRSSSIESIHDLDEGF